MTTPLRPIKQFGARTYVDEVNAAAPNDVAIRAPEVDDDLDTLYQLFPLAADYLAAGVIPASLPPSGAAGGDLAGSSYPAPVLKAGAVTDAKIVDVAAAKLTGTIAQARLPVAPSGLTSANVNDAAVTRAKIASDAYLPPVPVAGDVSKVLGVAAGPTLAYIAPPGGPPTGAAGGDLAGSSYPAPVIAPLAIGTGKLAAGAAVRQVLASAFPINTAITAVGVWTDIHTFAITTRGGTVIIVAAAGWYGIGPLGSANIILTGIARDQVTPNVVSAERRFQTPGTGTVTVPLPLLVGIDTPSAGAHTYHVVVFNNATGISTTTGVAWPGTLYLAELA